MSTGIESAGPAASSAEAKQPVIAQYNVQCAMRDGTLLSADVYRPQSSKSLPTVLVRTCYTKTLGPYPDAAAFWTASGYAFVVQDVRGRGKRLLSSDRNAQDTDRRRGAGHRIWRRFRACVGLRFFLLPPRTLPSVASKLRRRCCRSPAPCNASPSAPAGRAHRDLPCWVSRFLEPKRASWELQRMWGPNSSFRV